MTVYTQNNLNTLFQESGQGKRFPVYLLFGDGFLVREASARLVDVISAGEGGGYSLEVVEGDNERVSATIDTLNTFSLFEPAKIVLVRNSRAFYSKKTAKDLVQHTRRAYFDGDHAEAARSLSRVLGSLGWSADDIISGRLRTMSETEWQDGLGVEKNAEEVRWMEELAAVLADRGITTAEGGGENLLEQTLRNGFAGGNILILTCLAVDKRRSLFKLLSDIGAVVDLSLAEGSGRQAREDRKGVVEAHINGTLEAEGKRMDPRAMALFTARTGDDLQMISQELAKLVCYVGDRTRIEEIDVREVVSLSREQAIYEIMEAVGERDAAGALRLISRLQEQSVHLLAIHSVVVRKVRQLLWAKGFVSSHADAQSGSETSFATFQKSLYKNITDADRTVTGTMAPYPAFRLIQQANAFTLEELVASMERLLEVDIRLKSGGLEPERLVESAIMQLCMGKDRTGLKGRPALGRPFS